MRICSNCGSTKTYIQKTGSEHWHISKTNKKTICHKCSIKEWKLLHPELVKKATKRHYDKNKIKIYKNNVEWKKKNPELVKKATKRYYDKNKIRINKTSNEWRKKNPELVKKHKKRYYQKNKEKIDEKLRGRKIRFKGKQIRINHNPRTGTCSKCKRSITEGEIKLTQLHHTKYDQKDPLKHTVELCASCHRKVHTGKINLVLTS